MTTISLKFYMRKPCLIKKRPVVFRPLDTEAEAVTLIALYVDGLEHTSPKSK